MSRAQAAGGRLFSRRGERHPREGMDPPGLEAGRHTAGFSARRMRGRRGERMCARVRTHRAIRQRAARLGMRGARPARLETSSGQRRADNDARIAGAGRRCRIVPQTLAALPPKPRDEAGRQPSTAPPAAAALPPKTTDEAGGATAATSRQTEAQGVGQRRPLADAAARAGAGFNGQQIGRVKDARTTQRARVRTKAAGGAYLTPRPLFRYLGWLDLLEFVGEPEFDGIRKKVNLQQPIA